MPVAAPAAGVGGGGLRPRARGARLGGGAGDVADGRVQLGECDRELGGRFGHGAMVPWARPNRNCMVQTAPMRPAMANSPNWPAITDAKPTAARPKVPQPPASA